MKTRKEKKRKEGRGDSKQSEILREKKQKLVQWHPALKKPRVEEVHVKQIFDFGSLISFLFILETKNIRNLLIRNKIC